MIQQKNILKLKESLGERNIEFKDNDSKRDLIDKLWADKDNKNKNYSIKQLRCKHLFHLRCLREWLQKRDTCPVCRAKVYPETSKKDNTKDVNNNDEGEGNQHVHFMPRID
mmetsp:Transcript_21176/g.17569  ORF Transcript_21176/g.17569 Transcript_21176/m.17569 type:complete len:111 (+) Transcript_21176:625-957(+)